MYFLGLEKKPLQSHNIMSYYSQEREAYNIAIMIEIYFIKTQNDKNIVELWGLSTTNQPPKEQNILTHFS